jgi:nitroreductase
MMSILDLASKRVSVRSYDTAHVVEKNVLDEVIEVARLAPSACNKQPWRLVVVKSKGKLTELSAAYDRDWFKTAPVVLAVVVDHTESWHRADGKDHADVDASIFVEHLCLAAAEKGLGTCWVCNFNPEVANKVLGIDGVEKELVALVPIGYPSDNSVFSKPKVRKDMSEIVSEI